jgi:omega-hydroxy-beta-dihydromenaquinone-9 sulfotransferase
MESKDKKNNLYKPLPITGTSLKNWIELLIKNDGVELKYVPKALYVFLRSLLNTPLMMKEQFQFEKEIERVQIQTPPLFIIGHCRSGTTYLHHLMGKDLNFGYITKAQVLIGGSEIFLGSPKLVQSWADRVYPTPRKTDGLMLYADEPAEEEIAMANSSPYSFYTGFYFPKKIKTIFQRYVVFEGVDESEKQAWKNAYKRMLSRIYLSVGGKRLLIKNPLHTGRIKLLLDLFPNAKFIHIFRNPYKVYASTNKLYQTLIPLWQFQTANEVDMEENILLFYQELMNRYFSDKNEIPSKNLFEIKYEHFIGNEIEVLQQIYQQFNLPEFDRAKPKFEQFVASERNRHAQYQLQDSRSKTNLDEKTRIKVEKAWNSIIEQWEKM